MKKLSYVLLGMSISLVAAVCFNPFSAQQSPQDDAITHFLPTPEPYVPAPPVPAPNWQYVASVDPLTDATIALAGTESTNTFEFGFPYNGRQRGTLGLRKDNAKNRLDVFIRIEQGQIMCSSYNGCPIEVRFDSDLLKTYKGNGPADHSRNIVFLPNTKQFVERLKKSSTVIVSFTAYQEGTVTLHFNTKDLVWE